MTPAGQMILQKLKDFFDRTSFEQSLLFLCILFLPTQFGKHFFFDFSYIYSLRIDYLSLIIYFWDLLCILLLGVWIIRGMRINKTALSLLLLFILSQSLSTIAVQNPGPSLVRLEQLIITGVFGVYLASKRLEEVREVVMVGFILAIILEGIIAVWQFLSGGSIGFWIVGERDFSLATSSIATFNWYGQVFLRPYATFPHPNVLAAFMVLSLGVLTFLYFKSSVKVKINELLGVALGIGFLTAFLTFSRAALIVLAFESLFFLKQRLKLWLIISALVLPFLFVRFDSAFNFDSLSILRREELAQIAINHFNSSPLFGIGLNNFIIKTASSEVISGPSRFLQPVHNIFLLTISETGLIGFLGFLIFLAWPIKRLWQIRDETRAKFMLGFFTIIIFLGMFDHYFLTLAQGQRMLFLIWGLSMLEFNNGAS